MQRRMIYSKIWTSEQFGKLSKTAKLIYIGTLTLADDQGRLRAHPSYLRGQIFPYDDIPLLEMDNAILEILSTGLVKAYQYEGEVYFYHPKWDEYQHIRKDRITKSKLPNPSLGTEWQPSGNQMSANGQPKLSKVKLSKVKREETTTPPPNPRSFFQDHMQQEKLVQQLVQKGVSETTAREEVQKFISYWTETNQKGKMRWEGEKYFNLGRRLGTWFRNYKEFNKKGQGQVGIAF